MNVVNVSMCYDHSTCLEELTITEECLMTRSYSLDVILKLRSSEKAFSLVTYQALREHMIILSQNFESLLHILSSSTLRLLDKIKVV